ncbi:MAG TPA: serine/threonine-protein kinase, partial [Polyangiaceae bacterium]
MDSQAEPSNDTGERHPGEVIAGKYLLLAPLGSGGMGQVWTAENLATGAEVAVKLLHASRARSGDLLARFRQEAHATAQLMHRGIIRVFDLIEQAAPDGSLAIVMERLRGRTLAERLHSHGPLGVDETLDVILPLLGALQYAHGLGIIHRDLKPENVFLATEPDGEVIPKVLDFGISKMVRRDSPPITLTGLILGTPSYMSPEQLRAETVDARSDVFSVGILLYECLTGRNP